MFLKMGILLAVLHMGFLHADTSCENRLSPEEIHKLDLTKCIELRNKSEKVLSVDDSLRKSGKEIKEGRAPSVEIMYRKSTRQ